MNNTLSRFFTILSLYVFSHAGLAATELEFAPSAIPLTPDGSVVADKARILQLGDGTLFVIWHQAAGPPGGAWSLDGTEFRPRDIFVRVSVDRGISWSDPVNVSGTAGLTDAEALYDRVGDGSGLAAFYGDSDKASVMNSGNNVLVTWNDSYCGDGIHGPASYDGPAGTIELPYRCLYAARLTVSGGVVSVIAVDRITDATRDATNEVVRATGAGFAMAWQEDPAGLQLGEARGEGDGASGARVTPGTDIWYAWMPQSAFTTASAAWNGPVAISDNFDYEAGAATGGGASRPMLGLAGSPPTAVVVYEEMKFAGPEDKGKYVRFHQFRFNAPQARQPGVIISDPAENARRARVMAMMTPGSATGARLLLMWRQGTGIQGAPADFMMRVGSVPPGTDLATQPDAGLRISDLWPGVDADDPAGSAAALNLSGADLGDPSFIDPLANAKAHRAVMDGDFVYVGYTQDNDATDGVDEYQYLLRWSADGGRTWSEPAAASAGVAGSANVIEPRLVRTPGTVPSGDPRDVHNPDVFIIAWGTETNPGDGSEPYRDALFVTRTSDRGLSFERVQTMSATRTAADQTDEQIQLRVSPDGQDLSAVWIRLDSDGSNVIFNSAAGITPTADLTVAVNATDSAPDVGETLEVTFEISNAGPQAATELRLQASAGAGLEVIAAETDSGACVLVPAIECTLENLEAGATANVRLALLAATRGDWPVSAAASAWEEEPEPADNVGTVVIKAVPNADLVLLATTNVYLTPPGRPFDVALGVTNKGPQAATEVVVAAVLDGRAEIIDAGACEFTGQTLTCQVPDLAVGESWSSGVRIEGHSGGRVSLAVSTSSAETDPAAADNTAKVSVSIDSGEGGETGGGCVSDPDGGTDSTLLALLLLATCGRLWSTRRLCAKPAA